MPTYEYECGACAGKFELFQSMSAAPVTECQLCGKSAARRLIGAGAGVIFKGSGFYETDYKRAGDKKTETAKPAAADTKNPAAEKPAATKVESPPAVAKAENSATKKADSAAKKSE